MLPIWAKETQLSPAALLTSFVMAAWTQLKIKRDKSPTYVIVQEVQVVPLSLSHRLVIHDVGRHGGFLFITLISPESWKSVLCAPRCSPTTHRGAFPATACRVQAEREK